METIRIRADKYYTVIEISDILEYNEQDMFALINKHNPTFEIKDNQMVFLGKVIQELLNKLSCTLQVSP